MIYNFMTLIFSALTYGTALEGFQRYVRVTCYCGMRSSSLQLSVENLFLYQL